jgi:hypothetical protein
VSLKSFPCKCLILKQVNGHPLKVCRDSDMAAGFKKNNWWYMAVFSFQPQTSQLIPSFECPWPNYSKAFPVYQINYVLLKEKTRTTTTACSLLQGSWATLELAIEANRQIRLISEVLQALTLKLLGRVIEWLESRWSPSRKRKKESNY